MKKLSRLFIFCVYGEEGATAPEYAIIASLIAVVIAIAVGTLGTNVQALFESVKFW